MQLRVIALDFDGTITEGHAVNADDVTGAIAAAIRARYASPSAAAA